MSTSTLVIAAFAIAGASTLTPSLEAQTTAVRAPTAQQADPQDHAAHHPGAEAAQPPKPAETQAGAMHGQLMTRMKEQDATLDALVAKMNAAKGNAKVDAIAALLTAMTQQHKSMRSGMMRMHEQTGSDQGLDPR
jgi:hypothetical protein